MKDRQPISEIFSNLVSATEKYMSPTERGKFVYGSYGRLVATLSSPDSENPFIQESLNVSVHAAELELHGLYISCAMFYHLYLNKKISNFDINEQFGKDGQYILRTLDTLISLSRYFDRQLPWIEPENSTGNNIKRQRKSKTSEYWEKQNDRQSTIAFLALAQNPETAIIKLLERVYLLKNISNHPEIRGLYLLAQDTIEIYSPVAEAIGAWPIKSQLEDLAFKILRPEMYKTIAKDLQERVEERQARIERAIDTIGRAIQAEGVDCQITGRPKHLYGIFNKLKNSGLSLSEVNDILGLRIIVEKEEECYSVLNILDRIFHLAGGIYENDKTYRDWIAHPKPNKYQSIHTTISFEGHLLEIQIRTQIMHDRAEFGAASHWIYRKVGNSPEEQKKYQEDLEQIARYRRLYEKDKRRK